MHEKMLQSSSLTLDSTVSVAKGTVVPVPAYAHITLDIFFFYLYHFFCQLCLGRVSGITTLEGGYLTCLTSQPLKDPWKFP